MNKRKQVTIIIAASLLLLIAVFLIIPSKNPAIEKYNSVNRLPNIYPDYTETVIPPNIAPLNFMINEKNNSRYFVKISSSKGEPIEITTKDSKVEIPINAWKELLAQNRGQKIKFDIFAENLNGQWLRYKTISNLIANEPIDSHLAYRLLHPAHHYWGKVGIYQRDLENFDEKPILTNRGTGDNCMNCHSFCQNDPNRMMLHLRAGPTSGTLININGKVIKVNTSTPFNKAAGAYPAWHPNGKLIAFSVNQLTLFFHGTGESRDVLDHASDLIVYNIDSNTITTCPDISNPDRMETFPTWSPDGNYLYFCSAPKLENFVNEKNSDDLLFGNIRYDLMRIRYYQESGTWGKLDTVLSSAVTGKSINEPRISPDGRYLLFTMANYGNFPIYLKSSDVYILDLKTGKYFKPDVNSDKEDTFHSWSSNSRWFVFSSKRGDNLCARPYFSYFDKNGKAHKPFLLPQKDPEFYSSFLTTYNVPELIKGPVTVSPQTLIKVAYDKENALQAKLDPKVKPHSANQQSVARGQSAPQ